MYYSDGKKSPFSFLVYLNVANEMIQLRLLRQSTSSRQLMIIDVQANYVGLEQRCDMACWSTNSASKILQFIINIRSTK